MKFIKSPNLPNAKVKYAVCDSRIGEDILNELEILGCKVITTCEDDSVDVPISAHPDIHMFHLGNGDFYTSESFSDVFNKKIHGILLTLDCEIFNNRRVQNKLSKKYPGDVLFNAVSVGDFLICNKDTVAKEILDSYKNILHVEQGYTKCSVCIVSDCAIITDDKSIYNVCKNYFDVLLVQRGEIILPGYNYGFIGGSCGKISKDFLAFYGDVKKLSFHNELKSFCDNHGVYCISLAKDKIKDFGSLVPIIEE